MPRKRRLAETDSDDEFDDNRRPQRNAANERERARMRVLSKAFCRLKTTLPWVPADTKLSKLDTLRLATSYIAHLRAVLMDQPVNNDYLHRHPLTLVSTNKLTVYKVSVNSSFEKWQLLLLKQWLLWHNFIL